MPSATRAATGGAGGVAHGHQGREPRGSQPLAISPPLQQRDKTFATAPAVASPPKGDRPGSYPTKLGRLPVWLSLRRLCFPPAAPAGPLTRNIKGTAPCRRRRCCTRPPLAPARRALGCLLSGGSGARRPSANRVIIIIRLKWCGWPRRNIGGVKWPRKVVAAILAQSCHVREGWPRK